MQWVRIGFGYDLGKVVFGQKRANRLKHEFV